MPTDTQQTESQDDLNIVILAAGQGKRMKSSLPKVLHPIAGKSLLAHVIDTAWQLNPAAICVVYGHGGELVRASFANQNIEWALQKQQMGTGHAVQQAMPLLPKSGTTLILYGDVPLISAETLSKIVTKSKAPALAWLTADVEDPTGLGRIIRDDNLRAVAIVEENDATAEQRVINEINTGFLACPTEWLNAWLPKIKNHNAQREYYLTDLLSLAVAEGRFVVTAQVTDTNEIRGVNTQSQLAELERIKQRQTAQALMDSGVTLADPARIDVRGDLKVSGTVLIDINCIFEGRVELAAGVRIGAHCLLRNCKIGAGTEILPYTFIDGAEIGRAARIGPYARIRPQTMLDDEVHIGNFVEVKASDIGQGSKANHLSYIGDASVGSEVNIGAGTITCNYDGANKHRTVIEDHVHIGSDVQLVAPVTIEEGATIAAGTTVWRDAPADQLTLNEKTQVSREDWERPTRA